MLILQVFWVSTVKDHRKISNCLQKALRIHDNRFYRCKFMLCFNYLKKSCLSHRFWMSVSGFYLFVLSLSYFLLFQNLEWFLPASNCLDEDDPKTFWRGLENVFSVTIFHLPRGLGDVLKMPQRRLTKKLLRFNMTKTGNSFVISFNLV